MSRNACWHGQFFIQSKLGSQLGGLCPCREAYTAVPHKMDVVLNDEKLLQLCAAACPIYASRPSSQPSAPLTPLIVDKQHSRALSSAAHCSEGVEKLSGSETGSSRENQSCQLELGQKAVGAQKLRRLQTCLEEEAQSDEYHEAGGFVAGEKVHLAPAPDVPILSEM
ncbi:MAG: hypothetical protein FRX49_12170 [Trebouxia sp. A1-2]|nr:MAG: hypothetical protein FRX49_12170 [Trebouxia sp. A1-2]